MNDQSEFPDVLELPGSVGLRLLAHEARQRVVTEIYDGHDLTATEAADLCGLTPSAMSYHLRLLQKAGVVAPLPPGDDGRERRYRRTANSLQIVGRHGAGPEMHATVMIWIDSLSRAANRWLAAGGRGHGAIFTESMQLTEDQNTEFMTRLRELYRHYGALAEHNGPDTPRWESYCAHLPKPGNPPDARSAPDTTG